MATSAPVVEKVTRTRTIPAAEVARENSAQQPDFWEYIESLEPGQWVDHVVYLYREDPKESTYSTEPSYVDKFSGTIDVRPGVSYPMDDRGIIEHAIREKHGGKAFRLICKKGKQWITIGKCVNGAPPKYPDADGIYPQQQHRLPGAATDASVASKAIDVMASQQPEAVRLAMDVLRSASEIVMRQANPPAPAAPVAPQPPPRDPLVEALLQKALNPPDPFEQFMKFKNMMGEGGLGGTSAIMEKVLGAAVDKMLNPAPAVTGRTTLLDIGREFVPVLGTVMHEYRLSREADARIAEMHRTAMPPQAPPAAIQPNPPATLPAPQPQPVAAQTAPAAPQLTFQQIEAHIAKIIKNVEFNTDEAVDKVLEFLYDTDPRIVGALLNPPSLDPRLKPGKDGLMMLFTAEAELQPCLTNLPRLSEFLDKFIVAATEEEINQARLRAAAPASPKPS